jgi:hypothetical protein
VPRSSLNSVQIPAKANSGRLPPFSAASHNFSAWTMEHPAKGPDWSRKFDVPIPLPMGDQLITLEDAGTYIIKLAEAEHMASEWQAAMEALILVATLGGPTMFARIGVMRALNRHVVREFDSSRKDLHWGRRKLKRDMA